MLMMLSLSHLLGESVFKSVTDSSSLNLFAIKLFVLLSVCITFVCCCGVSGGAVCGVFVGT